MAGTPDGDWHLADGTPGFRLTAESPAIGKGLQDGTVAPDFDGKTRSVKDAIDIGALQH